MLRTGNQPIFCLAEGLFPPQASLASLRLAAAALVVGIRLAKARKSRNVKLDMELEGEVWSTMTEASLVLLLGLTRPLLSKFKGMKGSIRPFLLVVDKKGFYLQRKRLLHSSPELMAPISWQSSADDS